MDNVWDLFRTLCHFMPSAQSTVSKTSISFIIILNLFHWHQVVKAFNHEHSIRLKHVQAMVSDSAEYPEHDVNAALDLRINTDSAG